MRRTRVALLLIVCGASFGQTIPPNSDVFQTGTAPVDQAFQNLYKAAAEIVQDPGCCYRKPGADQNDFPTQRQAQTQWKLAVEKQGGNLSQNARENLIPCAGHLNNAITDMEIGYRIHIEQGSPLK